MTYLHQMQLGCSQGDQDFDSREDVSGTSFSICVSISSYVSLYLHYLKVCKTQYNLHLLKVMLEDLSCCLVSL